MGPSFLHLALNFEFKIDRLTVIYLMRVNSFTDALIFHEALSKLWKKVLHIKQKKEKKM